MWPLQRSQGGAVTPVTAAHVPKLIATTLSAQKAIMSWTTLRAKEAAMMSSGTEDSMHHACVCR